MIQTPKNIRCNLIGKSCSTLDLITVYKRPALRIIKEKLYKDSIIKKEMITGI